MTALLLSLLMAPSLFAADAGAASKPLCLDDLTSRGAKAGTPIEVLLQQVAFSNLKNPKTGAMEKRIVRVDKDSVYEKGGVKVGDLITTGCITHEEVAPNQKKAPPAPAKKPAGK